MNPVNRRLGRNDYAARAHKKHVRAVANQLVKETDWKGELAEGCSDVIETENNGRQTNA